MRADSKNNPVSRAFFSQTYLMDTAVSDATNIIQSEDTSGRTARWGARLAESNDKEAARLNQAYWTPTINATCLLHTDQHNGRLSQVTFCARSFQNDDGKWVRDCAVVYSRKAIDEYEVKRIVHRPYLQEVQDSLCLLDGRHEISSDIFKRADAIAYFKGVCLLKTPCNLEVESFYQAFVANCVRLQTAFSLDEYGLASVTLAMGQSMCSAGYCTAATDLLLAMKGRIRCDVGWCLLKAVQRIDVWNSKKRKKDKILPPLRFPKYETFSAVGKQEWMRSVRRCVQVLSDCRSLPRTPTIVDYNVARRTIQGEIGRVGDLRSNHLMGILSVLGFLPLTWFPLTSGGANKAYAYLETKYPNSVPGQEECFKNVHHAIEAKLGRRVSIRYAENAWCKSGRILSGSDGQFWDLIDPRFPLFVVRGNSILLFARSGSEHSISAFFTLIDGTVTTGMECNANVTRKDWMQPFI
jgi:hypothetical protein